MRKLTGMAAGVVTAVAMCSIALAEGMVPLAQSIHWPGIETAWQYKTMYLTSAPNDEGFKHAKEQGVTTVINLLTTSEDPSSFWPKDTSKKSWLMYALEYYFPQLKPWDEAQVVEDLGLRYESVPIDVEQPDPAAVERFLSIVQQVHEKQVLIHCDAAGRALAMWAIYLGTAGGLTPEQALAQAEQAGLTNQDLKDFALQYLQKAQKVS